MREYIEKLEILYLRAVAQQLGDIPPYPQGWCLSCGKPDMRTYIDKPEWQHADDCLYIKLKNKHGGLYQEKK